MKFFKFLISKIGLTALAFLVQLIVILVVLYYFDLTFVYFHFVNIAISLILMIFILKRKETPEFKISWLVFLLLFPLFTLIIYMLFAHPKISKKDHKILEQIHSSTNPYLESDHHSDINNILKEHKGIDEYLYQASRMPGHLNNNVKYYKSGEACFDDYLKDLNNAKEFIFIEYFIIQNGTMWNSIHKVLAEKAKQGVEVRMMYDDVGTLNRQPNNYYKQLQAEGIKCVKFNKTTPVLVGRHNNRDHRKITVIDGVIGYTGGLNYADEYINLDNRLGYWKDTVVRIKGSSVNNLTALFLELYELTTKTITNYDVYFKNQETIKENGYTNVFGDGPNPYYKDKVTENVFLYLINQSKNYLYISTPYLIIDYNLTEALSQAAKRGVDVRIVTPSIPDKKLIYRLTRSSYPYLLKNKVKIYEYKPGFIHAKMVLVDGIMAYVGTSNFDYRSLVHHYECGALLYKVNAISDIKDDFDEIFKVSYERTIDNFKINKFNQMLNTLIELIAPLL